MDEFHLNDAPCVGPPQHPAPNKVLVAFAPESISDAALISRYLTLLSGDERNRYGRIIHRGEQKRFLIGRALARFCIARATKAPASQISFREGEFGKPVSPLAKENGLAFNISHTSGAVVVAVTHAQAVGVDVEDLRRPMAFDQIAERFFAPEEAALVRAARGGERVRCFFTLWTLKEAYVKARGCGMSLPFDKFAITDAATGRPRVTVDAEFADGAAWELFSLSPSPHHILAVAVCGDSSGGDAEVELERVTPFASYGTNAIGAARLTN